MGSRPVVSDDECCLNRKPRFRSLGENREAGVNPARTRHCDRGVLTVVPLG
jgi:hypothetical protein